MKFSPGCKCCIDCDHLPDQLYLLTPFSDREGVILGTIKVPFTYDSGSGLWLCAVTAFSNAHGGAVHIRNTNCTEGVVAGASTIFVYQMTPARVLTRQIELCELDINGVPFGSPINTAPGSLSGSNLFGSPANTGVRGTFTASATGSCSGTPPVITAVLYATGIGPGSTETVTIDTVPP
jgi:hypothetical protein